jgi:hypothetical protein
VEVAVPGLAHLQVTKLVSSPTTILKFVLVALDRGFHVTLARRVEQADRIVLIAFHCANSAIAWASTSASSSGIERRCACL